MTDDEARAANRSRPWLPALQWALGITATAAIIAGSFFLGRVTAPGPADDSASTCEDARQAFDANTSEADRLVPAEDDEESGDLGEARMHGAVASQVVVQNPDCFTASERARAQVVLDLLDR